MLIMKKFYTAYKSHSLSFLLATSLFTTNVFAQTPPVCGDIVQNFDNTGGTTANYTGNFMYGMTGSDGYLVKDRVIAGAIYSVTTPTYRQANNSTTIGYGFELDGSERVARVEVAIVYISTLNNEMTTIFLGQFVPTYNTAVSPAVSLVCRTVSTTELPGFPQGGQYRLRFEFTPNTGNGAVGQTITFDDFRTNGSFSAAPLPVTFVGFDAKRMGGNVQLTWKVAGEENVARYEVERSTDGRNFTVIGSLATSKHDTYTFSDPNTASTVYYRVRNVDTDGKFKYTNVARLVNGKASLVLKAFPTPVVNQLTIQHPAISSSTLINVSAADGRIIRSIRPTAGSLQTFIDMSNLQKGLYMVRFDDGDGNVETMKIIKQ